MSHHPEPQVAFHRALTPIVAIAEAQVVTLLNLLAEPQSRVGKKTDQNLLSSEFAIESSAMATTPRSKYKSAPSNVPDQYTASNSNHGSTSGSSTQATDKFESAFLYTRDGEKIKTNTDGAGQHSTTNHRTPAHKTAHSSGRVTLGEAAPYIQVDRAWGTPTKRPKKPNAGHDTPMARWERQTMRDEPWNPLGAVPHRDANKEFFRGGSKAKHDGSKWDSAMAVQGSSMGSSRR